MGKKVRIAILTMTLLTMSIGMATAVPMIYDISYDPITNETDITNNATSQSALELHGHNNGEIVNTVWLAPGGSITFYENGTHSSYRKGTNKKININKRKGKNVWISSKLDKKIPKAEWKNNGAPDSEYKQLPRGEMFYGGLMGGKWFYPPFCIDVRGKANMQECVIETLSDGTEVTINPEELPQYLPKNQFIVVLRSGGLQVETDTDEFLSVMTQSSSSGGGAHTGCIPEFTTIAIPVTAILGLMFLFSRRKRKE